MTERPILFSGSMVRAILAGEKVTTRRVVKFPPAMAARGIRHDILCYSRGGPRWREYEAQLAAKDPDAWSFDAWAPGLCVSCDDQTCQRLPCPYGAAGDVLWCREAWSALFGDVGTFGADWKDTPREQRTKARCLGIEYRATPSGCLVNRWVTPLFMPRWASRLSLRVTGVRVERLHAITPAEVLREGVRLTADARGQVMTRVSGKHPPTSFLTPGEPRTVERLLVAEFASLWSGINGRASWDASPWVWCVDFEREK